MNPLDTMYTNWKEVGLSDKKQAKKFLSEYRYHSLPEYLGAERPEKKILELKEFPEYYTGSEDLFQDIEEWMELIPEIESGLF